MVQVGDVVVHKKYPAIGVVVAFHEWSPKSTFGRNVLITWASAPSHLYFIHEATMYPCHYDAGCEQRINDYFDVIGHIDLEDTDGSSSGDACEVIYHAE